MIFVSKPHVDDAPRACHRCGEPHARRIRLSIDDRTLGLLCPRCLRLVIEGRRPAPEGPAS